MRGTVSPTQLMRVIPAPGIIAAMARVGRPRTKDLGPAPNRIREVRLARKLSLAKLGRMVAMNPQTLQRYETGERGADLNDLEKIARSLGVHPRDLVNDGDAVPPPEPPAAAGLTPYEADELDRMADDLTIFLADTVPAGRPLSEAERALAIRGAKQRFRAALAAVMLSRTESK